MSFVEASDVAQRSRIAGLLEHRIVGRAVHGSGFVDFGDVMGSARAGIVEEAGSEVADRRPL